MQIKRKYYEYIWCITANWKKGLVDFMYIIILRVSVRINTQ